MDIKIAFITTPWLREFVENSLNTLKPHCDWEIIEYERFKDLPAIFEGVYNKYDGFVTSGMVAQEIMYRVRVNKNKPVLSWGISLASLYKLMLVEFTKNQRLNLDKVIGDLFLYFDLPYTCTDLLNEDIMLNIGSTIRRWCSEATMEQLIDLEEITLNRAVELYRNGDAELVVSFFSSLMQSLEKEGIPCAYAYPELSHIDYILNTLLAKVSLERISQKKPAVICVSKKHVRDGVDLEWDFVSMQKSLLEYNREHFTDFLVKRCYDGFEVYCSLEVIKKITLDLSCCTIKPYVESKLGFAVDIGYGVGEDLPTALSNAYDAKRYSTQGSGSYVIDASRRLTGPLICEDDRVVTEVAMEHIEEIAKQAKLSVQTIYKLYGILQAGNTKQLTVKDIVGRLGGTTRNANRILQALVKNGLATVEASHLSADTGRPAKVYQIQF